jgi:ArsR family metal-binding transcriptional regulator
MPSMTKQKGRKSSNGCERKSTVPGSAEEKFSLVSKVLEILKLLPKTNCGECGQPTCMVFATQVAEGGKDSDDCPTLDRERKTKLARYLGQFEFEP